MRKKPVELYQSGKGYKTISKALGHYLQVEKTYNSGESSGEAGLIQEVTKTPRITSKELQAFLASVDVSVCDSTIRTRPSCKAQSTTS